MQIDDLSTWGILLLIKGFEKKVILAQSFPKWYIFSLYEKTGRTQS
jgi:hypothetical protein